jgi:FlaA1/EpsC-like NDP-sugar epimerase
MISRFAVLLRSQRASRWALAPLDAFLMALAFAGAYLLAFDFAGDPQFQVYRRQILPLLPALMAARLIPLGALGLYRARLRYAGLQDFLALAKAIAAGTLLFAAVGFSLPLLGGAWPGDLPADDLGRTYRVPIRVLLLEGMLSFLALGALRAGGRIAAARADAPESVKRVIVAGAGPDGAALLRQMLDEPAQGFLPVGVVEADAKLIGSTLRGLRVESVDDLGALIEREKASSVLVAMPDASPELLRRIVDACRTKSVSLRKLPAVRQALEGTPLLGGLEPLRIEDLLGRESVRLEIAPEADYLAGRRVLVTGAGGSIGSELCRRVAERGPEVLLALGHGENSLFQLKTTLAEAGLADRLKLIVADIRDANALRRLFERERPQVIFHAAAHKHVALMEDHPREAFQNNILATARLTNLALEHRAERLVFISTDKAARPASIMGASKRVAEWHLSAAAQKAQREGLPTRFCATRFGNVLGSRGSVVPLFQRQLERGGPLTVTHPDATRYFMTAPEAAALTLQAGALADNGALYLLDMGEPVRIVDLARQMIALAGRTEAEIGIQLIGLQPGEKLREDLLVDPSQARATSVAKVWRSDLDAIAPDQLASWTERLARAAEQDDARQAFRAVLREIIPDATL